LIDADHQAPIEILRPPECSATSALRPAVICSINDFADELLKGERNGKYSPIEVAQWIEDYAADASKNLARLEGQASRKDRPEYRRLTIDVAIEAGLGRFFGAKFRSGVLYRIYEQTGDRIGARGIAEGISHGQGGMG